MIEYIEREAVIESIMSEPQDAHYPYWYADNIKAIPADDVAPVRHGRWKERKSFHAEGGIVAKCSACQKDVQYLGNPLKFCPNCGAKMGGE